MNKKVLILSSSPRKGGNSDVLCDKFLEGAKAGQNEVVKVFLKDKNINYCSGCGFCNTNDYTQCSQKDDMEEIIRLMCESDVIVMATPVYFYTMCAQMKTLIDRCCSRYTRINDKDFYFILTAADERREALLRTVEEFRGFLACLNNAKEKQTIYATSVWKKGEIEGTHFIEEAYSAGLNV